MSEALNDPLGDANGDPTGIINNYEADWKESDLPDLLKSHEESWKNLHASLYLLMESSDEEAIHKTAVDVAQFLQEMSDHYERVASIMLEQAQTDDFIDWANIMQRREYECRRLYGELAQHDVFRIDEDSVMLSLGEAYADRNTSDGSSDFLKLSYYERHKDAVLGVLSYASDDEALPAFCDAAGIDFHEYDEDDEPELDEDERDIVEVMRDKQLVAEGWETYVREGLSQIDVGMPDTMQVAMQAYDKAHAKLHDTIYRFAKSDDNNLSLEKLNIVNRLDDFTEGLRFFIDVIAMDNEITDPKPVIEKILGDIDLRFREIASTLSAKFVMDLLPPMSQKLITEALTTVDEDPHMRPFGMTHEEALGLLQTHLLQNTVRLRQSIK